MSDTKDKPCSELADGAANKGARVTTRRGFLKKAVVTGLAVGTTGVAAKKVGDRLLKEDFSRQLRNEERMARASLEGKRLVLMSEDEKREMIEGFEAGSK